MEVKVAVCQKPPVLLDLAASMERALQSLDEAVGAGARLVVFPQAYLPGYPTWIWRLRPGGDMALGNRIHAELRRNAVDLVCLAGYMRILSGYFIREFPMRILNIHPSLLPAFPGLDAQHQALAHGVHRDTGCGCVDRGQQRDDLNFLSLPYRVERPGAVLAGAPRHPRFR